MAEEQNKQPPDPNAANPAPPQNAPAPDAESDSLDAPAVPEGGAPATPAGAPAPAAEPPAAMVEDSAVDHLKSSFNIYFIIFVVIIFVTIGIIVFAVSSSRKGAKTNNNKAPSLTSAQLAELKGNTTLVGDSKQTLDIQSNSVFEGQVLARQDLSIAGALKVGGSLSLPSVNVGNAGTFGSVQVGGELGVNGNTTLQGTLTVQKNLSVSGTASFGSLSVGTISVTGLQLTGDLSVSRHIVTNGTSVSRTAGTALGGGGTVSVSGTDTAGTMTVNTGNSPAVGLFATVNFSQHFASTPRVLITPVGSAAGSITYYVNRDTTGFSIGCSTPPPAGSSFSFDYFVIN
ncbi:MAG: hypothetical protein JWO96_728 [Candidatus Saccharibacteria bacterium]|nr:hypothetical protein [Candidatus Saccharibacteria bacterium]